MFYRPGGSSSRINPQQDTVYADYVGAATGWLPAQKGYELAVNVSRASLVFVSAAKSTITPSPIAPEAQIILEMKLGDGTIMPIDQWQNTVVATSRRLHREGWIRLRIVNINNGSGDGVVMNLQVSRTGESGAVT